MLHTMTSAAFVRSPSVLRDGFWSVFVAERERWVLWLPVALGIGIAVYFALPRELVWFSGPVLLAVSLAGLITVRRGSLVRLTMVLVLFSGAGFSAAQWRTHKVAAPVLAEAQITTALEGRVVTVEPAARGPRVVLDRVSFMGTDTSAPERVRVRLRATDEGVRPDNQLRVHARLSPPPDASYPGGYDFSHAAWFQRIGAVGFALAPATISPGLHDAGLVAGFTSRFTLGIERARVGIATRIADSIGGPAGGVAAALATGQRGGIPENVRDDMRDSGLAHLLAISGLHLGLVAGFVFALVRGGLALWPRVALG
jgi:competence protein ComEC